MKHYLTMTICGIGLRINQGFVTELNKTSTKDIGKIYLYVKDPFKSTCQLLIDEREKEGIKKLKNPKAFVDYSQTNNAYENLEDYNPIKRKKVLIVLDDVITDMEGKKKLTTIVAELFLRGTKLSISLVFISQCYFKVPKTIRLNAKHYFIMKIPNKRNLQLVVLN